MSRPPASSPTLHFMCGKAGAGKSTLAAALAREHAALLLSEDICMQRLFGDQMHSFDDYLRFSKKLKSVIGPLVIDLLKAGQTVVLDFQANTRAGRRWFRSLFEAAGAAHCLHFVDSPDALCLQRIALRNAELPEGAYLLSEADFHHVSSFFEAPGTDEALTLQHYPADPAP